MNPLVNFAGIGPGKSGTSWLYEVLKQHPEICVSAVKETLYFSEEFHRGPCWYHSFFKHRVRQPLIGEVSNTYIFEPMVPQRMAAYNPEMRLLATLRDPVERAFSHYLFLKRNGKERGGFEEAIERNPHIVQRGFYYSLLMRYMEFFPRDQLAVLIFDDLKKDPVALARRTFQFLGVNPEVAVATARERVLPASRPRNAGLALFAKRLGEKIRRTGRPGLVARVKNSPLMKLLFVPYRPDEYPRIDIATRDRLRAQFLSDVEKLSEFLDRDMVNLWFGRGKRT